MTLVYAIATPDIGFMVSDTLLQPLLEIAGNPIGAVNGQFHVLKIQIIDGKTAVAFASANNAAAALNIIKNVKEKLDIDPAIDVPSAVSRAYVDVIAKSQCADAPDCEFLVLKILEGGKRLSHVTQSGTKDIERGYIGDPAAYKRLMELKRPVLVPSMHMVQQPDGSFVEQKVVQSGDEIEFEEISAAMNRLAHESKIEGVGVIPECVLRVVNAKISGQLEYLQSGEAAVSPEEGNAGFTFLASNSEPRGMGVFWPAGKVGFVLAVGDTEGCRTEVADSVAEFIANAEAKYGLRLTGVLPGHG